MRGCCATCSTGNSNARAVGRRAERRIRKRRTGRRAAAPGQAAPAEDVHAAGQRRNGPRLSTGVISRIGIISVISRVGVVGTVVVRFKIVTQVNGDGAGQGVPAEDVGQVPADADAGSLVSTAISAICAGPLTIILAVWGVLVVAIAVAIAVGTAVPVLEVRCGGAGLRLSTADDVGVIGGSTG